MLVDHTPRRGFERGGERAERVDDVIVDGALKLRRFVAHEEGRDEKEQLRLPAAEVAHGLEDHSHVALLLSYGDRGRMLACARQPGTVAGALDFDQTLGAAAHRADLFAQGGAAASRPARATERTDHEGIIV